MALIEGVEVVCIVKHVLHLIGRNYSDRECKEIIASIGGISIDFLSELHSLESGEEYDVAPFGCVVTANSLHSRTISSGGGETCEGMFGIPNSDRIFPDDL